MLNFVKCEHQKLMNSLPLKEQASMISDEKQIIMPLNEKVLTHSFITSARAGTIGVPKKNFKGACYQNVWGYTQEGLYVILLDVFHDSDTIMEKFGFDFKNLPEEEYLIALIHQYCPSVSLTSRINDTIKNSTDDINSLSNLQQMISKQTITNVKDDDAEFANKVGIVYSLSLNMRQEIDAFKKALGYLSEYNSDILIKYLDSANAVKRLT